jgi:2-polyprenyl-3-methyl-5-hydroxy-6-metoxy-1,4-benzoquinol methylase
VRIACPLCEGPSSFAFKTRDRNRGLSEAVFNYRVCDRCGAIYLSDPPEDLGPYYPEEYYVLPTGDGLERAARAERYKLDLLGPLAGGGRLVEIGPGPGTFALAARRSGYDVTGIEMDARSCEHLRAAIGVEAVQSDSPAQALRALPPSRVIALWHVLEHLPDPWETLDAAAANLEPGGVLAVAVPNPKSFQFRMTRARWPHVDAPRHLFLIPAALLEERARVAGLELVRLTARDRGGIYWNRFGWQHLLTRPRQSRVRTALAVAFGIGVSALMAPIELTDLRGTTYTAIFRKRIPEESREESPKAA